MKEKYKRWNKISFLSLIFLIGIAFSSFLLTCSTGVKSFDKTIGEPGTEEVDSSYRITGKSSISGRIVSDKTGKPLVRVEAYLVFKQALGSLKYYSDENGNFSFKNIPAGDYFLRFRQPNYQEYRYHTDFAQSNSSLFQLKENERKKGLEIRMEEAFVIRGAIYQNEEKGAFGYDTVHAFYKSEETAEYYNSKEGNIDFEGNFVIDTYEGQPFYLLIKSKEAIENGKAYSRLYYPGVFSFEQAELISFEVDTMEIELDLNIYSSGGTVLSGIITDEENTPIANTLVAIHNPEILFDYVTAYTNSEGYYKITGVTQGNFMLQVDASPSGFVRYRKPFFIEEGIEELSMDLTLKMGATLSGIIIDSTGKRWPVGRSIGLVSEISSLNHSGITFDGVKNKYSTPFCDTYLKYSDGDSTYILDKGYYHYADMIFDTESTFIIHGAKPGKYILFFRPLNFNGGYKPYQVRIKGKNIDFENNFTTPILFEVQPGEVINDIEIVVQGPL